MKIMDKPIGKKAKNTKGKDAKHKEKQKLSIKKIFANMLKLQEQLNIATAGEDWKSGVADNGKIINWFRCMHLEAAELIESYPYKHWKDLNKDADMLNVKVETTDIWHFLMSQLLVSYDDIDKIANILVNSYKEAKSVSGYENQMTLTETFLYKSAKLAIKNISKISDNSNSDECIPDIALTTLTIDFFTLTKSVFENGIFGLENLYYGKNALNQVRQNNGYKNGTYVKMWSSVQLGEDPVEDNVVMMHMIDMSLSAGNIPDINNYIDELQCIYQKSLRKNHTS